MNGTAGQMPGPQGFPTREVVQEHIKRYHMLRSQGATEQTNAEMSHLAQVLSNYKVGCLHTTGGR